MSEIKMDKTNDEIDYNNYNNEPWKVIESYFQGINLQQAVKV